MTLIANYNKEKTKSKKITIFYIVFKLFLNFLFKTNKTELCGISFKQKMQHSGDLPTQN